jgi:hypothetical protein
MKVNESKSFLSINTKWQTDILMERQSDNRQSEGQTKVQMDREANILVAG